MSNLQLTVLFVLFLFLLGCKSPEETARIFVGAVLGVCYTLAAVRDPRPSRRRSA